MNFRLLNKIRIFLRLTILILLLIPISKSLAVDQKIFTDDDLNNYKYGNGEVKSHITEINITNETEKHKIPYSDSVSTEENYGAKESCPKETKEQAKQAIKSTWIKIVQAMVSGDIEKAFSYFPSFSRDEMKRRMSDMSREQLKKIFSNYKSIEIESLYQDDGVAECGILREEKDGTYSYPARFVRDLDCEWRLQGM